MNKLLIMYFLWFGIAYQLEFFTAQINSSWCYPEDRKLVKFFKILFQFTLFYMLIQNIC